MGSRTGNPVEYGREDRGMVAQAVATDNWPADIESDPESDAALVLSARKDLRAFEPLYRRYADRVYRYCIRRLGDPDRAADATSAIFIKAMQSIDRCQPESFRSWLFSIAHNTTVDAIRTSRSHASIDDVAEWSDGEMDPEVAALAAESRLEIIALLGHLTTDQRQVVELRLAGLDGYEIAEALGKSRASVDTAQSRAVARLRRVLCVHPSNERREDGHAAAR
jgi:RNA polymerase sigma-70 factor (ECF subfamily)